MYVYILPQIMCGLGNARVNAILEYEIPEHVKKPTPNTPRSVAYSMMHPFCVESYMYMFSNAMYLYIIHIHIHVCCRSNVQCTLYNIDVLNYIHVVVHIYINKTLFVHTCVHVHVSNIRLHTSTVVALVNCVYLLTGMTEKPTLELSTS